MKKRFVYERTGIPYTLIGVYYLPWGYLPNNKLERRAPLLFSFPGVAYYNESEARSFCVFSAVFCRNEESFEDKRSITEGMPL